MKRKLILAVFGLALLIIGFAAGRIDQHSRSGYHYKVRDKKDYDSPIGPIHWSYVTESIGMPLIDPGSTILEFEGRTIYKAQRGFQESTPYARNISATQEGIAWEDGDFHFDLTIRRMNGEQGGSSDGVKPPN